jgi:hypothetical protein
MTTTLSFIDESRALAFYNKDNVRELLAKYDAELDYELRDDPVKLATYILCRESGVDKVFAAMRACRRSPGAANCDQHFNRARRAHMNGMGRNADKLCAVAQKAGISTQGKFYVGGLGRYTDPHAWVSTIDDVVEVAKKKNLNLEGVVNHKASAVELAPPKKTLAPDIVRRWVKRYCAEDPGLAAKCRKSKVALGDLKEKILHKHGKVR